MERQGGGSDAIPLEQGARMPSVFTTYGDDMLQHAEGANRNIAEVTYWCADDVERAGVDVVNELRRPARQIDREVVWRTGDVTLLTQTCSLNFASSAGRGTAPTT